MYRASWVLPVDQPPISNGIVRIENGIISDVGPMGSFSFRRDPLVDLGDGAIIPGLINSHTHLEFSLLDRPLGEPGIRFTDWIRLIVRCRSDLTGRDAKSDSIRQGLNESFRAGVWAIGDIVTSPFDVADYKAAEPGGSLTLFQEVLGRDRLQFDEKMQPLVEFFSHSDPSVPAASMVFGASPHAPYSVHADLLKQVCESASDHVRPVAMHVAETREERELLKTQTGNFVELLKDLGVWDADSYSHADSIGDVLESLSRVQRSIVVHGNYLTPSEFDFIAAHRERMSVVFCPRTHAFFDHEPYPLGEMRRRNIRVAVGTDSRASNPDLNLFEEMKHVTRTFPEIPLSDVLEMGTMLGALALGIGSQFGTIAVGKKPALSFVSKPVSHVERDGSESVFDWLFSDESYCVALNEKKLVRR